MTFRSPGSDRRKNPARVKADITYDVIWNADLGVFDVYRGDHKTEAFAQDHGVAVAHAITEAKRDQATGLKVVVFSLSGLEENVEWTG